MVSNAHKRIIWGLSWCPSVGDGAERLVTASRDGTMKLWQLTPESTNFAMNCLHTITPANGVPLTAISVLPMMVFEEKEWIVSVGMESGALQLWRWPAQCPQDAALVGDVGEVHRHSKTVKKTIWRPNHCQWVTESQRLVAEVASVSEDHSVRIHRVQIKR